METPPPLGRPLSAAITNLVQTIIVDCVENKVLCRKPIAATELFARLKTTSKAIFSIYAHEIIVNIRSAVCIMVTATMNVTIGVTVLNAETI